MSLFPAIAYLSAFIQNYFIHKWYEHTLRGSKISSKIMYFLWILPNIFEPLIRRTGDAEPVIVAIIMSYCLVLPFFYRAKIPEKIAAIFVYFIVVMGIDLLAGAIVFGALGVEYTPIMSAEWTYALFAWITISVQGAVFYLARRPWDFVFTRVSAKDALFISVIGICQLYIISSFYMLHINYMNTESDAAPPFLFYGITSVVAFLISNATLIVLFRQIRGREKEKAQLKSIKDALQAQYAHDLERAEFNDMILKARHDMKSQILTTKHLLDTGERELAAEHLESLEAIVLQLPRKEYCDNFIINAVIQSKVAYAKENGISVEVELPIKFKQLDYIRDIHYCSIFSNMLDNAIEACVADAASDSPVIELKAITLSGYVFIKVINPIEHEFKATSKKQADANEHGFGLGILNSIAKTYGGSFTIGSENAAVSAVMALPLAEPRGAD